MTVTDAKCSKYRGRFWWAIGLLFAAVLGVGPSIYGLYGVTYEAKAEAKDAASDSAQLKVKVDAQDSVLSTIEKDVREVRTGVAEINEWLRNGKGD